MLHDGRRGLNRKTEGRRTCLGGHRQRGRVRRWHGTERRCRCAGAEGYGPPNMNGTSTVELTERRGNCHLRIFDSTQAARFG